MPTPSTCVPPSLTHTHKPYSLWIHSSPQPEGAHCLDLRALRPEGRVSADRLSHLSWVMETAQTSLARHLGASG